MTTATRNGCIRAAIVGLALFICMGATTAQNPAPSATALAMARELMEIKGASRIYDPIFLGVIEKAKFALMQSNPMLQQPLNQVTVKLRTELRPKLDALKQEIAGLYAKALTEQELKQVLTFYKTPLGAKLLTVEPKLFDQSMQHTSDWAEKFSEEALVKIRNEMRKLGHEL